MAYVEIKTLLGFCAIAALSIMSPGPAVLLTLRNGVSHGPRSVCYSALGNVIGVACLSSAAALGLGLLLRSSATLFLIVKLLGAAYLFYMGFKQLFSKQALLGAPDANQTSSRAPGPLALFGEAFLIAATNPKALLFFTSLFPQFVDSKTPLLPQFLILTGAFMLISYLVHLVYAQFASRARELLFGERFARQFKRVTGTVFVGFGVLLLTLRRVST